MNASRDAGVHHSPVARRVNTTWELLRVGWDRAWAFTPILRRSTPAARAAATRWSWQWLVVVWLAVCVLPASLLNVCSTSSTVWIVDGASATVRPTPARHPGQRARGASIVWTAAFVSQVAFLLLCFWWVLDLWWPGLMLASLWMSAVALVLAVYVRDRGWRTGAELTAEARRLAGRIAPAMW